MARKKTQSINEIKAQLEAVKKQEIQLKEQLKNEMAAEKERIEIENDKRRLSIGRHIENIAGGQVNIEKLEAFLAQYDITSLKGE